MAEAARRVVLLAGRLGPAEADAAPLRQYVDRLRDLGFEAAVVALSGGAGLGTSGVFESPGLADRWRRPWAVRRLTGGDGPPRPDLIHVLRAELDLAGLELAERWRVPYVQSVGDYPPAGARLRLSRAWCRALVAAGPGLADELARNLGVPRGWISIVPPGIAASERGAGPDGRVPVVGAAGPLVRGSGLGTFLDAARRVVATGADVEFVVAGDGPGVADLRRVADRLGVASRVAFTEAAGSDSSFWRVLDVSCHPSLVPTFGRPLALAMAHGVPAIAADVEGLRGWVEEGRTGVLVPPGDPAALATAILDLLADPDRARRLGRLGQERIVRDFHPDREAAGLAAVYRLALGDADAAPPAADGHRGDVAESAATRRS